MKKVIITIIITLLLCGCTNEKNQLDVEKKISKSDFKLDTYIDITLYGTDNGQLIDQIYDYIDQLENRLSLYKIGSDTYNIKKANGTYEEVSDITINLINESLKYSNYTDGLFDVTAAPLIDLWAINSDKPHVPTTNELDETLAKIDYNKISVADNKVKLDKHMYINLGAIAKGYIADLVVLKIKELGIANAIVNLGGNVYIMGTKPNGSDYKVGVQHPDMERNEYFAVYSGSNKSVVTSGTYERYYENNGIKYHHILNPCTGYPVDTDLKSVTIISDTSLEGDGLSTSTLLLGLENSISLINNLENVGAVFVTKDNKIYITENIKDDFVLTNMSLEITVIPSTAK